jgi:hypothetical protein
MLRGKLGLIIGTAALVMLIGAAVVLWSQAKKPALEVRFLRYTNGPQGELAAVLEIKNRRGTRVARNACRITPEPSGDKGFWYVADVASRRLEPNQREEIFFSFRPGPMSRWRATVRYVRNPTSLEYDFQQVLDWLDERGLSLSRVRKWCEAQSSGQVSTEWNSAPPTKNEIGVRTTYFN